MELPFCTFVGQFSRFSIISNIKSLRQINLQKKKSACRTYFSELKPNEILLGQEPYMHKNRLISIPQTHKGISPFTPNSDTPRVCIVVPRELGKVSFTMTNFTSKDMITIRCNLKGHKDALLCSLYLGHLPNKPEIDLITLTKFKELVKYSNDKNLALIMGADSNGHHASYGTATEQHHEGGSWLNSSMNLDSMHRTRVKTPPS